MHPSLHYRYCPSCGAAREAGRTQPLLCETCGFKIYVNITPATGGFLRRGDGKVLFIIRGHEPAKGKLAIPGGFVDDGETAEEGLRREFMEEVGVKLRELSFLCSHPNAYLYCGVTYPVLDFFFVAEAAGDENPAALDAVESFLWLDPMGVKEEEMAFPSMAYALRKYKEGRAQ
jgi:ADP-ribose pyrophosphatase YjhB (NUDIX family)